MGEVWAERVAPPVAEVWAEASDGPTGTTTDEASVATRADRTMTRRLLIAAPSPASGRSR